MFWVSAFLDLEPASFDAGLSFWRQVTGYTLSPPRGDDGEFATLVPPSGDAHLRVQRLGGGPSRIHLDLHVADPALSAKRAMTLGASVDPDFGDMVMRSPGGFAFCFVSSEESRPAAPVEWAEGLVSMVDQVCLDIPSSRYGSECAFWRDVTGRELRRSETHNEFRRLVRPEGQPLQLLLQRLDQELGPVTAHLDLATTDRAAETERHRSLGAEVLAVHESWTVLADPTGAAYCLTDRTPETRVPAVGSAR